MAKKRNLYFFTSSYPYDIGEQWKTNELLALKNNFEITVIPYYSSTKTIEVELINEIHYKKPIFDRLTPPKIYIQILEILFSKHLFIFLSEFFKKKVFIKKKFFIQWIAASYKVIRLLKNSSLTEVFSSIENGSILYFFWGREISEVISALKLNKDVKLILRLHGYDLYEERTNNYMPYRTNQLKKIHLALFVSKHGYDYLLSRYKKINFKGQIFRLGTKFEGLSKPSTDSILRIFSCSSIIPLKRVELIGEALFKLNFQVVWTHIGGGDLFDKLKKIVNQIPKNINVNLVGQVKSSNIKRFYLENMADLFINVSTTEGVPISIMEALSAGIPILATNVGGTSEIVDVEVGKLLPAELSAEKLADEIRNFYYLPNEKKQDLRGNAYNRFKKRCDASILAKNLSDYLECL